MCLCAYVCFLSSVIKGRQCYTKMLKWFVSLCAALLNKMLFVDLGVTTLLCLLCFIPPTCYNLTIMMEPVSIFLPSYFSITFLTKGKISKSASLFLRHIGSKQCWGIRLQNFISNISLEKGNEIVYFFTCWYQKLRVDKKRFGWVWSEMIATTLVTRWMDKWMDELSWFFVLIQIQESYEWL